jgi:hypothetical protein
MATFKPLGAGSWRNSDGLIVYFGPTEGTAGNGGEYRTTGANRQLEAVLDLAQLTSTAAYLDQHFELPKNAYVESVEVEVVVVAASSGSGTVSVGLKQSDQSTNISDTALVSALDLHATAVGTKFTLTAGSTGAGSSIGTAIAANGLLTVKYGTAAYQTGRVLIRVNYNFLPLA